MNIIGELDENQLAVILEPCSEKRNWIHQWKHENYPTVPHKSLSSPNHEREEKRYIRCTCNDIVQVKSESYREGMMANNKDESFYVYCKTCDNDFFWEPNYDSLTSFCVYGNNVMIFGSHLELRKKRYNSEGDDKEIDEKKKKELESYLKKVKVIVIDAPKKQLSNEHLACYIDKMVGKSD